MKRRFLSCALALCLILQPLASVQAAEVNSDLSAELETEISESETQMDSAFSDDQEDKSEAVEDSDSIVEDLEEGESSDAFLDSGDESVDESEITETEIDVEEDSEAVDELSEEMTDKKEEEKELTEEELALLEKFRNFDLDLYEAKLFTGDYSGDIDNVLKWWTPAEILAADIKEKDLETQMDIWKLATLGGGTVANKLSEVDVCQMILLDMLDTTQDSAEVSEFISDEFWSNMLVFASNYSKVYKLTLSDEDKKIDDFFKVMEAQSLVGDIIGQEDMLKEAFGISDDSVSVVSDLIGVCNNVYDLCCRMSTYVTLQKYYGTTMPETIRKLKGYCSDSTMKIACDNVISLLQDNESTCKELVKETGGVAVREVSKKLVDKLIDLYMEASGLSVLLAGQKLGIVIANKVYNTDEICGKVFTIKKYQSLIEGTRELVRDTGNTFRSSQTSKDASIYINAISLYMTGAEKGCDYANEFAQAVKTAGVGGAQTGNDKACREFQSKCDNIKTIYTNSKKFILHDLWRGPFEEDYPEIVKVVCDCYGYAGWSLTFVPARDISSGFSEVTVKPGDPSFRIQASVEPANATCQTLSYKSSNTNVAEVTGDGWVKVVGLGSATITVYMPYIEDCQSYLSETVKVIVSNSNRTFTVEPYKYTVTREFSDGNENEWGTDGTVSIKATGTYMASEIAVPEIVEFWDKTYTVTELADRAFASNINTVSITLPDTINTIGSYAFSKCEKLTSLVIPEGVTEIKPYTFSETSKPIDVTLPDGLTKIGKSAFYKSSIENITIPESVTVIDEDAFEYSDLKSIVIPKNVYRLGRASFCDCKSLESVEIKGKPAIEDVVFAGDNRLASIDLGQSISLGERAIDMAIIKTLTIPKSMISIDKWFYDECPNLETIIVETGNTKYASKSSALFSADFKTMYRYPNGNIRTTFTVPSTVTRIDNNCFRYNLYLKTITLPAGLTYIGTQSFLCCQSLTGITIPDKVTGMGTYCFHGCLKLKKAVLGNGITKINDRMFYNCQALTDVTYPTGLKEIGIEAFAYCPVQTLTFPKTLETIGSKAFYYNYISGVGLGATSVTIPASVTYIGNEAFRYNCLNKITFATGSKVKAIPNYCFSSFNGKDNLTSLTLPATVQTIGQNAFANHNLKTVTIPATVYEIGSNAFYSYNKTTTVTFKGDPPIFPKNSFSDGMIFSTPSAITQWKTVKADRYNYNIDNTAYDLSKCTVKSSKTSVVYTGSAQKPSVTVTYNGQRVPTYQYTVSYSSNTKIGKATITVKGAYKSSGTKTTTFKIVPKATSITSLTSAIKAFTVKWASNSTATGYQIKYSTSSTFASNNKTVTVSGSSTVSKKISSLLGGKKYYVKVRVYKTVNSVKYYSAWSAKKYVTTKK